ncbi:MAG: radical SAM family heme chaperone HemW [Desulfosoma sp.]
MTEGAGLYVHVPFCRGKCRYCGFYSTVQEDWLPAYVEALLREAHLFRDRFTVFDTLYVGGGTPSLMSAPLFRRMLRGLRSRFVYAEDCEVTLEVNPEDVSSDTAALWRDEGITRISVGVQTLDDVFLTWLGRRHTARRAREALEILRRFDCFHLSVDIMYAIPGQSLRRWLGTLREILAFKPEHLSCYELTVEKRTPLAVSVRQGRLRMPSEEVLCLFFERTSDFLQSHGYLHYEISNYARCQAWVSRHNGKYWRRVPYLGLGPGAHSFDGRKRWANVRSVPIYVTRLHNGSPCTSFEEELSLEQERLEQLLLGFRTREGVPMDVLGTEEKGLLPAQKAQAEGLMQIRDGALVPTRKGWLVADQLPLLFV